MNSIVIAADAAHSGGSWGNLVALVIAAGIFWVGTRVHKRIKAVREGKLIDPFSSQGVDGQSSANLQVGTPVEGLPKDPEKG